jgi:hypothetical protein
MSFARSVTVFDPSSRQLSKLRQSESNGPEIRAGTLSTVNANFGHKYDVKSQFEHFADSFADSIVFT